MIRSEIMVEARRQSAVRALAHHRARVEQLQLKHAKDRKKKRTLIQNTRRDIEVSFVTCQLLMFWHSDAIPRLPGRDRPLKR